jgi:type IV pilus assembly protein PilM
MGTKRAIGLDIGTSSIKLIELAKTKQGIEVLRAKMIEIDTGLFVDAKKGHQVKWPIIQDRLRQLLQEEKVRNPKVAIPISGQSCIVRPVKLPKISHRKIDQLIKYEIQQQVPFPMDEVVWDYEAFSSSTLSETDIVLVAAKKEVVFDVMTGLIPGKVPIDIATIDAVPIALYNAVFCTLSVDKPVIVLDIGTWSTNIVVVESDRLWTRSIPIGSGNITDSIAEKYNVDFKQAENLKRNDGAILMGQSQIGSASAQQREVSREITFVLMDLLSEVSRSIGFYKTQYPGTTFGGLFLTGGGSKLKGIDKFFEKNLNISCLDKGIFDGVSISDRCLKNLGGREEYFSVAFGLALREIAKTPITVNLLPPNYASQRQVKISVPYFVMSSLLVMSVVYMGGEFIKIDNRRLESNLEVLEKRKTELETYRIQIEELRSGIKPELARTEFLEKIMKARQYWLQAIVDLNKELPQKIWILNFSPIFEEQAIRVRMLAKTDNLNLQGYAIVAEVPEELSKTGRFQDIIISDISDEFVSQEERNLVFTITAKVVNPELQKALLPLASEQLRDVRREIERPERVRRPIPAPPGMGDFPGMPVPPGMEDLPGMPRR